jgi:hypothetical protein
MKKLNPFGFAHHVALMAVVVLIGVGGSAYMVLTHADSCTATSDPVSVATSDTTCTPTSDPVSDPTTPVGPQLGCVINGVPANPAYGTKLAPTVTITNSGDQASTPITATEAFGVGNDAGNGHGAAPEVSIPAIDPGASYVGDLYGYTVPYADEFTTHGGYQVSSDQYQLGCEANFVLPVQPLSYNATCSVGNIATTVTSGASVAPTVTVKNTGTGPLTPQFSYSYLATQSGQNSPAKIATMGTIAAGQSATLNLPAYALSAPYSQPYRFSVTSQTKGVNFTCTKTFNVTVPVIQSLTVNPTDWKVLTNSAVTTDGSHGSVVKISKKVGAVSGVYTTNTAVKTSTYPNGTPLPKVLKFVQADFGRPATVCVNVRGIYAGSQLVLAVTNSVAWHQVNGSSISYMTRTFSVNTTYAKRCFDYTIASKADYLAHDAVNGPNIWVRNAGGSTLYVDSVTVNLR